MRPVYLLTITILLTLVLSQCATQKEGIQIIESTEFPVYHSDKSTETLEIMVQLLVVEDGYVERVYIVEPTGNESWDQAVKDSLLLWRFTNPPEDSSYYWTQHRFFIDLIPASSDVKEKKGSTYAQIILSSEEQAHSFYTKLSESNNVRQVVSIEREKSDDGSIRFIEPRFSSRYPGHIRRILHELHSGEFTSPIPYNGDYVIFLRMNDES